MKRTMLGAAALLIVLITAHAQPTAREPLPGWVRVRLEALRPSDPLAYFLLGEEVSYELRSPEGRKLACTLFVLAYQIDPSLGPHVCMALADMTAAPEERKWLLAMAESMGVGRAEGWADAGGESLDEEPRTRLAEGIRAVRGEDGRPIRDAMSAPRVQEYLATMNDIDPTLVSAITKARESAQALNGCPRCRNQRVVSESANKNVRTLCPRCGGNPGLALDDSMMLSSMRLEARLRRVEPTTWSGALILQQDAPLRDVRPDDLARAYGVDPDALLWTPGGWTARGTHQRAIDFDERD